MMRRSTVHRHHDLARYYLAHGHIDEAARHARRAVSEVERGAVADQGRVARLLSDAAGIEEILGRFAAAADLWRQAVACWEEAGPAIALAEGLRRLGEVERILGRLDEAETTLERANRLAASTMGGGLTSAWIKNARGIVAKDLGRFAEAEALYCEALAETERELGSAHPETAPIHHNFAGLDYARGRPEAAERHIRRALSLRTRAGSGVASDQAVLAAILVEQSRLDEAEAAVNSARQTWEQLFGPDHYEVAACLDIAAVIAQRQGRLAQARSALTRALAIFEVALGREHRTTQACGAAIGSLDRDHWVVEQSEAVR